MKASPKILCYLEGFGGGVEMTWGSLQQDPTLHWSPNALLDAFVHVLLGFLLLVCTILNFFTSSFIRVSGFSIPCSYCTHLQRAASGSAVEESSNSSKLAKSKSISAPVVSEVRLNGFHHNDEHLRDGELKNFPELSPIYDSTESTSGEPLLEISEDEEGEGSIGVRALLAGEVDEKCNDRSQEDLDKEQYAKAEELFRALQSEREVMAALHIELEEERRSSATAAREALAMISRLQEEKAAVQMESRQFQRIVMEKVMYDQEAIEVLTEILAKREDERLALEEEIELHRERLDAVLMEGHDYAERAGRDPVPMLLLEGVSTEAKSTSPRSERVELLASERIISSGRIGKDERITGNGRIGKDERITLHGRFGKNERITLNGRLAKEEEAEFLDRLNKTKSQLLTALLQEGISEPAIALEESGSFANEIHKAMAKIPVRGESLPILDHESYKASLELGAIKIGRESVTLPIPPSTVGKKHTEMTLAKDAGKAYDEPVFVSRKPAPPSSVVKKQIDKASTKDTVIAADEPVCISLESTPPAVEKKHTEKLLTKDAGEAVDEPVPNSDEMSLPILPPLASKRQDEKAVPKDPGNASHDHVFSSCEASLAIIPDVATEKQTENVLVKDDGKAGDEPMFASLKRRWSDRGSQEISVVSMAETLAKEKEDRRIEEKRLSVLEYVRNLEEQLQQQTGRAAARTKSVDGREEDVSFGSLGQYERSVSVTSGSSSGPERAETVQRRVFADGDSVDKYLNANSFEGEGYERIYAESDDKVSHDEGGFYGNAGILEESGDESLSVHDVYEVENHPHEASSRFGASDAGTLSGLEMQSLVSDRLGKPCNLNVVEEDSRNNDEQEKHFLNHVSYFLQGHGDCGFETQWTYLQRKAEYKELPISTFLRNDNSRSLEEEVEQLTHCLKALEADKYLMKQTIDTLRRENDEMKLLQEISLQLREC